MDGNFTRNGNEWKQKRLFNRLNSNDKLPVQIRNFTVQNENIAQNYLFHFIAVEKVDVRNVYKDTVSIRITLGESFLSLYSKTERTSNQKPESGISGLV